MKAGITMINQYSKELAIDIYINKSMNNGNPTILIKSNQNKKSKNKMSLIFYNPGLLL